MNRHSGARRLRRITVILTTACALTAFGTVSPAFADGEAGACGAGPAESSCESTSPEERSEVREFTPNGGEPSSIAPAGPLGQTQADMARARAAVSEAMNQLDALEKTVNRVGGFYERSIVADLGRFLSQDLSIHDDIEHYYNEMTQDPALKQTDASIFSGVAQYDVDRFNQHARAAHDFETSLSQPRSELTAEEKASGKRKFDAAKYKAYKDTGSKVATAPIMHIEKFTDTCYAAKLGRFGSPNLYASPRFVGKISRRCLHGTAKKGATYEIGQCTLNNGTSVGIVMDVVQCVERANSLKHK